MKDYLDEPALSYWVRARMRGREIKGEPEIEILTEEEAEKLREALKRIINVAEEELRKKPYTCTSISGDIERIIINDYAHNWEWEEDDTGQKEVYCRELDVSFREIDDENYYIRINSGKEMIKDWKEEIKEDRWLLNRAGIKGMIDTVVEEIVEDEEKIREVRRIEEKVMAKIDEVENRICDALGIGRKNTSVFADYGRAVLKRDPTDPLDNLYMDAIRKEIEKELES